MDRLLFLPFAEAPLFALGRLLAFAAGRLAFGLRGAGRPPGFLLPPLLRLIGSDVWGTRVTSIPVHTLPTTVLYGRTKDSVTTCA